MLLVCLTLLLALVPFGGAVSCSFPERWSAKGLAFPPIRGILNLKSCQPATIDVDHRRKKAQIRSFRIEEKRMFETGVWIFENGQHGVSMNTPLFQKFYSKDERRGKHCALMKIAPSNGKPFVGALETNQHLHNLTLKIINGHKYYEKLFVEESATNFGLISKHLQLDATYIADTEVVFRVKIKPNGQCEPVSVYRKNYRGVICVATKRNNEWHSKSIRIAPRIGFSFVFDSDTYKSMKPQDMNQRRTNSLSNTCDRSVEEVDRQRLEVSKAIKATKCSLFEEVYRGLGKRCRKCEKIKCKAYMHSSEVSKNAYLAFCQASFDDKTCKLKYARLFS